MIATAAVAHVTLTVLAVPVGAGGEGDSHGRVDACITDLSIALETDLRAAVENVNSLPGSEELLIAYGTDSFEWETLKALESEYFQRAIREGIPNTLDAAVKDVEGACQGRYRRPSPRSGDAGIADKSVLTIADLPVGWEEGDPPDDDDDPAEREVPACEAIERAVDRGDQAPSAESPDFDDSNDPNGVTSVSNEVLVFPKAKAAKRYLRPFEADGEACLQGRGEAIPGALDVRVEELDIEGSGAGYTVVVTLESNGDEFTLASDVVVVRVGRAIASFAAENVDEPLPEGPDILDIVIGRLQESL